MQSPDAAAPPQPPDEPAGSEVPEALSAYPQYPEYSFGITPALDQDISGVGASFFNGRAYFFYYYAYENQTLVTEVTAAPGGITAVDTRAVGKGSSGSSITSCVHQGLLYVFWTDVSPRRSDVCFSRSVDGKQWSEPATIPAASLRSTPLDGRTIACVSAGERMYLFFPYAPPGPGIDYRLGIAYSDDGQHWEGDRETGFSQVRTLSACTFLDPAGPGRIMLGVVHMDWKIETAVLHYDPEGTGTKLVEHSRHQHADATTDFIALAGGSTEGGGTGATVQMFVNGWHGSTWSGWERTRKKEFSVSADGGRWGALDYVGGEYMRYPTWQQPVAFQFLVTEGTERVQQEVWYAKTYRYNSLSQPYICLLRAPSDKLVRVDVKRQPAPDEGRVAIGVVEGPPPYVLNGESFKDSLSSFEFGRSVESTAQVTTSMKIGAYLKIAGKFKVGFSGGLTLSDDLTRKSQDLQAVTMTTSKIIAARPKESEAVRIFARPSILRREFAVQDWQGTAIPDVSLFDFTVSDKDASIDYEAVPLKTFPGAPDSHDWTTWYHRFVQVPGYVAESPRLDRQVVWFKTGKSQFTFRDSHTVMESSEHTVKAEVRGGVDNIFDMGGNTSLSFEVVSKTTFADTIGLTLNYPPARSGVDTDISKVTLRVGVWNPDDKQVDRCYWIPPNLRDQRPWCVVWSIDAVEFQAPPPRKRNTGPAVLSTSDKDPVKSIFGVTGQYRLSHLRPAPGRFVEEFPAERAGQRSLLFQGGPAALALDSAAEAQVVYAVTTEGRLVQLERGADGQWKADFPAEAGSKTTLSFVGSPAAMRGAAPNVREIYAMTGDGRLVRTFVDGHQSVVDFPAELAGRQDLRFAGSPATIDFDMPAQRRLVYCITADGVLVELWGDRDVWQLGVPAEEAGDPGLRFVGSPATRLNRHPRGEVYKHVGGITTDGRLVVLTGEGGRRWATTYGAGLRLAGDRCAIANQPILSSNQVAAITSDDRLVYFDESGAASFPAESPTQPKRTFQGGVACSFGEQAVVLHAMTGTWAAAQLGSTALPEPGKPPPGWSYREIGNWA